MDRPAVLESDAAVYLASGLFAVLVFVTAVGALVVAGVVTLGTRETVGLAVGFLLYMGSYLAAMGIYRSVSARERAG